MAGAFVMMLAFLAGCGSSDEPSKDSGSSASGPVKVRVAYVPSAAVLPALIARDKGIFEKNGLDVELMASTSLATFAPGLDRQYDIAFATPADFLKASSQGLDVEAVSGNAVETQDTQLTQLVVAKDSGVKTVADLKGKTIGLPTLAGTFYGSLLYALQQAGLSENDVKLTAVPLPNQADQMKAGRIQAALAAEPFVGQLLATGATPLINPFLEVSDPALGTFWIATSGWAKENTDTIKKWKASLEEAKALTESDEKTARGVFQKELQVPEMVAQRVPFPQWDFSLDPALLDPWVKALEGVKLLPAGAIPDTSKLVAPGT